MTIIERYQNLNQKVVERSTPFAEMEHLEKTSMVDSTGIHEVSSL